jgi:hypothetical protein
MGTCPVLVVVHPGTQDRGPPDSEKLSVVPEVLVPSHERSTIEPVPPDGTDELQVFPSLRQVP